jgi:hypothetical protein
MHDLPVPSVSSACDGMKKTKSYPPLDNILSQLYPTYPHNTFPYLSISSVIQVAVIQEASLSTSLCTPYRPHPSYMTILS